MRIVIVGAGGHGHVVADALLAAANAGSEWEPVGYVDDNPALVGRTLLGLPVLGFIDSLARLPHDGVVVAIGDNERRRSIFAQLEKRGERFGTARHPHAVVAAGVTVGAGTMICAGVIVNPCAIIGSNVILNTACTIDHHSRIADHVHVGPGVHVGGTVTVNTAALVGIGATVMPGRTIGAGSVVGAGALVQQDVADATVVVGVPARPIRMAALSKSRLA